MKASTRMATGCIGPMRRAPDWIRASYFTGRSPLSVGRHLSTCTCSTQDARDLVYEMARDISFRANPDKHDVTEPL